MTTSFRYARRALSTLASCASVVLFAASPANAQPGEVDPDSGLLMVTVGDPGAPGDPSAGLGAVTRPFRVGVYEVTNTEYVELLNAVAATDTHGLFDENLMTDSDRGGILQSGSSGNHSYTTKPDFDDKPANGMTWYDAARFVNWLENGRPSGAQGATTTEDGTYDLSLAGGAITRRVGARYFLPTLDEWHKAAYHDPFDPAADAGGTIDWWIYPTRGDTLPLKADADASGDVVNPGDQVANHDKGAGWNGESSNVTTVGGCGNTSAWGTADMGGNVNEMTETPGTPIPPNPPGQPESLPTRRLRGGDFSNTGVLMGSAEFLAGNLNMLADGANVGFRVASVETWYDLGGALAGTLGEPLLDGLGFAVDGEPVTIELSSARPLSTGTLVLGATALQVPFKGGLLVPSPDAVFGGLPIAADGTLTLTGPWPAGLPPATSIVLQIWIDDDAAPQGLAASNGLLVSTP